MISISSNNLSPEEMLRLMQALKGGQNTDAVANMALKNLPADKQKQLSSILGNKQALDALLKSSQAQDILKKFGK